MTTNMPVPIALNTIQNRMAFYPSDIELVSDVQVVGVSFYENGGRYWFCLESSAPINSIPFFGLRNCVSAFKQVAKSLSFQIRPSDCFSAFVRDWEKSLRVKKEVP